MFPLSEHLFLSAGHAPPELTDPFVERLLIAGDFRIAIRNVGDVAVLQLAGRVTPGTGAEVFLDAIQIVSARGRSKILLNLAEVSNIDSSGIGEIVSSFTEITNRGGQVKIVNLTKRVQDLLQIARLYEVYDDEIRAIRSFAESRG